MAQEDVSCCFRWDVVRGPHEGASASFCLAKAQVNVLTIGRQKKCLLRFHKDPEVSGVHAEMQLMEDSGMLVLRDASSTNGTKLNGDLLTPRRDYLLRDNDLIMVGRTALRFQISERMHHFGTESSTSSSHSTTTNSSRSCSSESDRMVSKAPPSTWEPPRTETPDGKENVERQTPPPDSDFLIENGLQRPLKRKRTKPHGPPVDQRAEQRVVVCIICGVSLEGLDFLQQQVHLNACIDQKSTTANTSKKRNTTKKQSTIEKEQVQLAMALSISLASSSQTMDMQMALLTSELQKVEQEMQKLAKKRERIQKRMQKLAKQRDRIRPSQVVAPQSLVINVPSVLHTVFPMESCVRAVAPPSSSRQLSLKDTKIHLWTKASQCILDDYLGMTFVNGVLSPRAAEESDEVKLERRVECLAYFAPKGTERVFPKWKENVKFLLQQTNPDDIELALDTMKKSVKESDASDECVLACSFFEKIMTSVAHHVKSAHTELHSVERSATSDESSELVLEHQALICTGTDEPDGELEPIDLPAKPPSTHPRTDQEKRVIDLDGSIEMLLSDSCENGSHNAMEERMCEKNSTITQQVVSIEPERSIREQDLALTPTAASDVLNEILDPSEMNTMESFDELDGRLSEALKSA